MYKWISRIIIATFFTLIILNFPALCQGHSHHGHAHNEPPGFKYSKEAQQMHSGNHHSHMHSGDSVLSDRSYSDIILRSVASTFFISAAPFLILFLLPIDNTKECQPHLKMLLSFASGGLLGDAFLHLIPHALMSQTSYPPDETEHSETEEEHIEDHSHSMSVGICVLLGIIVFLVVEKIVRIIKTDHSHSHSHATSEKQTKTKNEKSVTKPKSNLTKKAGANSENKNEIKITGYMNLAADFLHNFTDGLAISASYLVSNNVGYITTFTIFCHEIPHEIGDFAILIQSGYSARKAMLLQLTTAGGAFLGTYVSFVAEGMGDFATMWILPFTAGGFIYIATVSIIPDLLTDTKFWQSVKEIIALIVGVGMMVLIAKYE